MKQAWGRCGLIVVLLALCCFVLWLAAGAAIALAVLSVILLALLARHWRNLIALARWLRDPAPETVPQSSGLWDEAFAALHRMLRYQRQSESRLSATLVRFQEAAAAMPDGVVILDDADRVQWCNPKAEEYFGLDPRRDTGQHITYLVRQPEFGGYLRAENYGEPLVMKPARGADLTLSVQLVPYGEGCKLVISHDVTQLERVETVRRDFVANVSHELRTPLTVLAGFLETMAGMPRLDNDMARRALPLMMDQARRMRRLVEDLLTLSRLEGAGNPLHEERVNVPGLARALYRDALALSVGRHRIRLELDYDGWLLGNEEELRSAFSNLVSNAIRYTPEAGEITLAWVRRGEDAVFAVEDGGIGIEPQHIPRLTERFYRVDRSRSRETGGTGLGLAIVKHVLARHQARLEIASGPGRGSRFGAVFPAQRLLAPVTPIDSAKKTA